MGLRLVWIIPRSVQLFDVAAVDEAEALAVALEGLEGHPDDAGLMDRAAEAALESGRFLEAEMLCRRGNA